MDSTDAATIQTTATGAAQDLTFEEWGKRLNAVYLSGTKQDGTDHDDAAWNEIAMQMRQAHPYTTLTWMNPDCGCCLLDHPVLLAFDDPRGPGWFELVYPAITPTHIYHFG